MRVTKDSVGDVSSNFVLVPPAATLMTIRRNLVANFVGKVVIGLLNFLSVPLYMRYIGVEGFAFIGLYLMLQALFYILETGLSIAINRELATFSALAGSGGRMRNFVRTQEIVYWSLALSLVLAAPLVAWSIGRFWLFSIRQMPPDAARPVLVLMVLIIALQWPSSLYIGGLMGLQRHVVANVLTAAFAALRVGAALLVLAFFSRSLVAFFVTQAFVAALAAIASGLTLWQCLPKSVGRPRFRTDTLRKTLRFSLGISGTAVFVVCLNQIDKIILSRQTTLADFGYYSLAWTLAASIYMLNSPIYSAVFPRLAQYVAANNPSALMSLYSKGTQMMCAILGPATIVSMFFAREILLIWTRNPTTAEKTHAVVAIIMPSVLASALLEISLGVQRAHGWIRMSFWTTVITLLLLTPLMVIAVNLYGALGGAACFTVGKTLLAFVQIELTHRRFMPGIQRQWYLTDVLRPLIAAVSVAALCRWLLLPPSHSISTAVIPTAVAFTVAYLLAFLTVPVTAEVILDASRRLTAQVSLKYLIMLRSIVVSHSRED